MTPDIIKPSGIAWGDYFAAKVKGIASIHIR
jgi:hypothetical protein